MAKPTLLINGHEYAEYIEELTPDVNDLDADGSGRDVQTGTMYRTRIAIKQKWNVKMLRLSQTLMTQLLNDLSPVFFTATITDPATGNQTAKTMYTSTKTCGAQRYDKETGAPYYDGASFSLIER